MFGQKQVLSENEAKNIQPMVLAQIGDAVQTLLVREAVTKRFGVKINAMNKLVTSVICAGAQFRTFKKIENTLSPGELDVAMRARNSHKKTKAKNFSYQEYIYASALEAVLGYLYLTGKDDRICQIVETSLDELNIAEKL